MTARSLTAILVLLVTSTASAKDERGIRNLHDEIATLEKKLDADDLVNLGSDAWSLYDRIELADEDRKTDPGYPKLLARWRAVAVKAAAIAGGHSKEILGDGKVPKDDDDREELYRDVQFACDQAVKTASTYNASDLKNLKDNYAKYEKALARALKADPTSVRHKNGHFKLFQCEWLYQQRQLDLEDTPVRDDSKAERYKTCGYDEYTFQRLKIGGRWGAWESAGVPGGNGYPLDCKKHPKANKLSGNMAALIRQEYKYGKGVVWAIAGQPTTGQEGLKIYQYQNVRVYAKDIDVATTDCGDKDPKLVCEASGSKTVRAYNALAHLVARADIHREAGRVDRCKRLYKDARHDAQEWTRFYDDAVKTGDWTKGLKYKTRNDGVLTEAKIVAKVKELSDQADERAVGAYCKK